MQVPLIFPELAELHLLSGDEAPPVILDSFWADLPHAWKTSLEGVPFPGLSKLRLPANHLTYVSLCDIPHCGYISPEAIVALLSALASLEKFILQFRSPQSRPDRESRSLPPPKRAAVLPALEGFHFRGVAEYLEDIVTFIDAPKLYLLYIAFFNQIDFDNRRLAQFINRTPSLRALGEARVQFVDWSAGVRPRYQSPESSPNDVIDILIEISGRKPDWQLSSIEQVCNSLSPTSTVENLQIEHHYSELVWKNDAIENSLWLQLLLSFTAVKNLHLSKEFAPGIALALQDVVGDRMTVAMPNLQNIFVEALEPSGLSKQTLRSSLPPDGFPATLSPFLRGTRERDERKAHRHVCTLPWYLSDPMLTQWCALRGEIGERFWVYIRAWHSHRVPLYRTPSVSSRARGTPRIQRQRRSESKGMPG